MIAFVPASYLADISKSSAESTSVITLLSLETTAAVPLPQSIFSNFMSVPPSMNRRQNPRYRHGRRIWHYNME